MTLEGTQGPKERADAQDAGRDGPGPFGHAFSELRRPQGEAWPRPLPSLELEFGSQRARLRTARGAIRRAPRAPQRPARHGTPRFCLHCRFICFLSLLPYRAKRTGSPSFTKRNRFQEEITSPEPWEG